MELLHVDVVVLVLFPVLVLDIYRCGEVTDFCCILNGKSRLLTTCYIG